MTSSNVPRASGAPSLPWAAAISLATAIVILSAQQLMRVTDPSEIERRGESAAHRPPKHALSRRALEDELSLVTPGDLFYQMHDAMMAESPFDPLWHDEFFAPLLDRAPPRDFHSSLRRRPRTMEPAFTMSEAGDMVSLVLSLPGAAPGDVAVELVGGRMVHIAGERRGPFTSATFDKRFSLGDKLNEADLRATLSKNGDLVVTAPKVGTDVKEERRKIPILEEL